jgi:CheY-like chemotaxis protein
VEKKLEALVEVRPAKPAARAVLVVDDEPELREIAVRMLAERSRRRFAVCATGGRRPTANTLAC